MLMLILSFVCCFARALIFLVLKGTIECDIFYWLSTFGFKTEASFNEKISFMRSGEKSFNTLNNSMVRNCEIVPLLYWNRIISLFLKVLCKFIYEAFWFCCLSVCRVRNIESFAHQSFISVTRLRQKYNVMQ